MKKNPSKKNFVEQIKKKRNDAVSTEELFEKLHSGDVSALGKAITLIESTNPNHFEAANLLLEKSIQQNTESIRVGITGVPGVGKSTFIEALGSYLTEQGKKVAVLAVDPTSSMSKGSILGDKTRMETLAKNPNAFIRPSPSGESLGGVSRKTRESILLCEAAGYDIILIETVGVGQSETLVHSMVDFFLLLKLSGAGDELQGIKRGIMEMADAIVIHKADGENKKAAQQAKNQFETALHLYPPKPSGWVPKVLMASSLEKIGIDATWQLIEEFTSKATKNGFLKAKRTHQNKAWFLQSVDQQLKEFYFKNTDFKNAMDSKLIEIEKNQLSPFHAAKALVERFSEIKA